MFTNLTTSSSSIPSISSAREDPKSPGGKQRVYNTISSIINPVFSAFQNQWTNLGKKIPFIHKAPKPTECDNEIQKILLEEAKTSAFLAYLHDPEKAPTPDWINTYINIGGALLTPLGLVACNPKTAFQADCDPFSELLKQGANPDKGIVPALELICEQATRSDCSFLDSRAHVLRARLLLAYGASLPKNLLYLAWLRLHCELQFFGHLDSEKATVDTRLPIGWMPPAWFPSTETLNEPTHKPKDSQVLVSRISQQREKWRPLSEKLNQYPLLPASALCISGLFFAFSLGRINEIALAALTALSLTPFVIARTSPLNKWDMQRLLKKALQNPLYKELWKKGQSRGPLKFNFYPLKAFERHSLKGMVPLADYNHSPNEIRIYQGEAEREALDLLVFETANAYQFSRLDAISDQRIQGLLEREEYARLMEYTECQTADLCQQVMDFGNEYLGWEKSSYYQRFGTKNWELAWELANKRFQSNKLDAHADTYRAQWDKHAFLHYLRHPENAPDADWINKSSADSSPLQLLVNYPAIALFWEIDPFLLLIERGAKIDSDLLYDIIRSAIQLSQELERSSDIFGIMEQKKLQISRARELLGRGIQYPLHLSSQERDWIQSIIE